MGQFVPLRVSISEDRSLPCALGSIQGYLLRGPHPTAVEQRERLATQESGQVSCTWAVRLNPLKGRGVSVLVAESPIDAWE